MNRVLHILGSWKHLSPLIGIILHCAGPGPVFSGTLRVAGGSLKVHGTVSVSNLLVESDGAWGGTGILEGSADVRGGMQPGVDSVSMVATQSVTGSLVFYPGSQVEIYASENTVLDRIEVLGPVGGTCQVVMAAASNAIPVFETIISGHADSDFSGFGAASPAEWQLSTTGSLELVITDLAGDTDDDNLPDWWELEHFSDRTDALPTDNPDNDAYLNEFEFIADTDPNSSTSTLKMTSVVLTADGIQMQWQGGKMAYQIIQCASELDSTGTVWRSIYTNIPPTEVVESVLYPTTNDLSYYRIQVYRPGH